MDLPDELLIAILSRVCVSDIKHVLRVCRRFASLRDDFGPAIVWAEGNMIHILHTVENPKTPLDSMRRSLTWL
jgi:hypothetical protein